MNENGKPKNLEELRVYEEEWTQNMLEYWRERMAKLRVYDTGRLYRIMQGVMSSGANTTIEHKFALYGIFVAAGVGSTMQRRREHGWLDIYDETYRKAHRLDKPRAVGPAWSKASRRFPRNEKGRVIAGGKPHVKRDWFSMKYIYSIKRLNETEASVYGEVYNGLIASALSEIFGKQGLARNL